MDVFSDAANDSLWETTGIKVGSAKSLF